MWGQQSQDINKDSAKGVGRYGNWDPGKTESAFLGQSLQMSPERTVGYYVDCGGQS